MSADAPFVFSTKAVESNPVNMEFADGYHIIPQWMVAHLGGTDAVTSPESAAKARKVTFEEFNQKFHAAVSRKALQDVHKSIINTHLRGLSIIK
jgi:hypothetical protein